MTVATLLSMPTKSIMSVILFLERVAVPKIVCPYSVQCCVGLVQGGLHGGGFGLCQTQKTATTGLCAMAWHGVFFGGEAGATA